MVEPMSVGRQRRANVRGIPEGHPHRVEKECRILAFSQRFAIHLLSVKDMTDRVVKLHAVFPPRWTGGSMARWECRMCHSVLRWEVKSVTIGGRTGTRIDALIHQACSPSSVTEGRGSENDCHHEDCGRELASSSATQVDAPLYTKSVIINHRHMSRTTRPAYHACRAFALITDCVLWTVVPVSVCCIGMSHHRVQVAVVRYASCSAAWRGGARPGTARAVRCGELPDLVRGRNIPVVTGLFPAPRAPSMSSLRRAHPRRIYSPFLTVTSTTPSSHTTIISLLLFSLFSSRRSASPWTATTTHTTNTALSGRLYSTLSGDCFHNTPVLLRLQQGQSNCHPQYLRRPRRRRQRHPPPLFLPRQSATVHRQGLPPFRLLL